MNGPASGAPTTLPPRASGAQSAEEAPEIGGAGDGHLQTVEPTLMRVAGLWRHEQVPPARMQRNRFTRERLFRHQQRRAASASCV